MSLIAFVIDKPGTNSIILPIIIVSRLLPTPKLYAIKDKRAAIAPPRVFIKKAFIPNSPALKVASFTNIPTKNDTTQSSILPPNIVVNPAAVMAENTRFVLNCI